MSRKHTNTVISEAVRWFHRFRMKGPTAFSPDESAEWARWSADKTHLAQYQRAEQLWVNLQHLENTALPTPLDLRADQYDPDQPISAWLKLRKPSEN